MAFTILLDDPRSSASRCPMCRTCSKLGIDVPGAHRRSGAVPAPDRRLRLRHDDDDLSRRATFPGNEQRDYWTCAAAKAQGSSNVPGICDPAVDALVEQGRHRAGPRRRWRPRRTRWTGCCCGAGTWCRTGTTWMFHVAYWDRFGQPGKPIREGFDFDTWWIDPAQRRRHRRGPRAVNSPASPAGTVQPHDRLSAPPAAAGDPDPVRHHRDQLRRHPVRPRRPGGADDRRTARQGRPVDPPRRRRRPTSAAPAAPIAAPAASTRTSSPTSRRCSASTSRR